jgi:HSP20 family molecular chaperone IbpA
MRTAAALVLMLVFSASAVAKDEPVTVDVANAGEHATAARVISHEIKLAGDCAVRGPDGKDVPSHYDSKSGVMRFLAEVPAGGGKFAIHPGEKSRAKRPSWKKPRTGNEVRELVLPGNVKIKRATARIENDLLQVNLDPGREIHGSIEIKALKGDYRVELSPLGVSYGNIDDLKHLADAKVADDGSASGNPDDKQLFAVFAVPEKAEVLEPNPFQRTLRVDCLDYARKNNDEVLDLFEVYRYEVTLTWGSPVVEVRCFRKQTKAYYNHNGVNLNEIHTDGFPIDIQLPEHDAPQSSEPSAEGRILNIKFKDAMLLGNKGSVTNLRQPDFEKLGLEGPCLIAKENRLMTVISQTWHQGWRAYPIKAGDYNDTLQLVCNPQGEKKLADWMAELAQ